MEMIILGMGSPMDTSTLTLASHLIDLLHLDISSKKVIRGFQMIILVMGRPMDTSSTTLASHLIDLQRNSVGNFFRRLDFESMMDPAEQAFIQDIGTFIGHVKKVNKEDLEKTLHKAEAEMWTHEDAQVQKMGELRRHAEKHQDPESSLSFCQRYIETHPDDKVAKTIWTQYEKEGELAKDCLMKTRRLRELLTSLK
jgi:Asp-tRNA(Asn)/Glu-tRNA(Gln) amidotransferase C subunit